MKEPTTPNGWIKLHRDILDSKLWSCSDATFRVAIYLILSANHSTRHYRRIEIQRGQCVRSLTMISEACHISRKAARYAIQTLKADKFIEVDEPFGAQQGHRITVCKYETYQTQEMYRGTGGAQEGTQEGNTNKNDKNDKNEKNNIFNGCSDKSTTRPKPLSYSQDFDEAWALYGRRGSKPQAYKYWRRLTDEQRSQIVATIPAYLECVKAGRPQKDFQGWINPDNELWAQDWKAVLKEQQNMNTRGGTF